MTNVVITYTGNVCSTPMIEYARSVNSLFVPVWEEFDQYLFSKKSSGPESLCSRLSGTLDSLYRRETNEYLNSDDLLRYRDGKELPKVDKKPHVFFKWRCYDPALPDADKIADVLIENRVKPVTIVRRSVLDQAIKVFLSEQQYGGRHQQFAVGKLSPEEYSNYLEDQKGIVIKIDNEGQQKIGEIATQFLKRTRENIKRTSFYFTDEIPLTKIVAEDIFTPFIDLSAYNAVLTNMFGTKTEITSSAESGIRKGGLELSNCANLNEVKGACFLDRIERNYQDLIGEISTVATN